MNNTKQFRIIKFKSKPVLAAKSISKSFDSRIVLRKIDIHVNQGEMLGFLGSNGAGKSTFMNIILGLLKPDFGDAYHNRGNAKNRLGDLNGACGDWRKAASLGSQSSAQMVRDGCN